MRGDEEGNEESVPSPSCLMDCLRKVEGYEAN